GARRSDTPDGLRCRSVDCTSPTRGALQMLDVYIERPTRHAARLLDRLSEILSILSQAHSAAHFYEELSRKGDSAPAEQGLKRSDVRCVAYNDLRKGFCLSGTACVGVRLGSCDRKASSAYWRRHELICRVEGGERKKTADEVSKTD